MSAKWLTSSRYLLLFRDRVPSHNSPILFVHFIQKCNKSSPPSLPFTISSYNWSPGLVLAPGNFGLMSHQDITQLQLQHGPAERNLPDIYQSAHIYLGVFSACSRQKLDAHVRPLSPLCPHCLMVARPMPLMFCCTKDPTDDGYYQPDMKATVGEIYAYLH